MLFKQSNKVTFVMYQDQKVAKCFELSKTQIKTLIWTLTILFLMALASTLFLMGNIKQIREKAQSEVPVVIKELQAKETELQKEIVELKSVNTEYLEKINNTTLKSDTILPLFSPTLGFKDLSKRKVLNVESLEVKFNSSQTEFNFNIVNNQPDKKLSGYIFIVMKVNNQIVFYPEQDLRFDDALSTFNRGETFSISRFRAVKGIFKNKLAKGLKPSFKVYIFSKTGDLFHTQSVGPVTVEY